MNRESDFQSRLDARPDDHTARLVFADWLQERGDPRAEGYRALGVMQRFPERVNRQRRGWVWRLGAYCEWSSAMGEQRPQHTVPRDWVKALIGESGSDRACARRSALENEFAVAFLQLPPERRAELLSGAIAVPTLKAKRKRRVRA